METGIVITKTPFRISLYGGGSDIPSYFNSTQQGAVIGFAVKQYLYVTLNSLKRLLDKKVRLSYSKLEIVDDYKTLQHNYVRQVLESYPNLYKGGFLDIHTFSDLPASSGVGSSSAFTVGFINALNILNGIFNTPKQLAYKAINIERVELGEAGGWQDQIWASYGGFNKITFNKNAFSVQSINVPPAVISSLEESMVIFFTGLTRSSHQVQHNDIKYKNPNKTAVITEIVNLTNVAEKIIYEGAPCEYNLIKSLGKLLHETWLLKKQLNPYISTTEIDELYSKGIKNGAIGGKLCGAGGGGFVLFIVHPENKDRLISSLSDYKYLPIEIEKNGSRVIYSDFIESKRPALLP
ncbi:MAG: hypothetical protein P1U40_08850 [Coxiellaceae bacterium]|nr:hypothetical protein [Coxiellaceae bacterium]